MKIQHILGSDQYKVVQESQNKKNNKSSPEQQVILGSSCADGVTLLDQVVSASRRIFLDLTHKRTCTRRDSTVNMTFVFQILVRRTHVRS